MRYVPKEKIRTDACDWLGITEDELDEQILKCRDVRSDTWDEMNPSSPEEIDSYYTNGDMLIENLVDFNTTFGYEVHFPDPDQFGDRVLDFGCGLAYTAEAMASEGKEVTIADVPNPAFSSAQHRFEGTGVKSIDLVGGMLPFKGIDEEFDAIFCIDVIEHIVNPVEMIWHFYQHLSPGGLLYMTNLDAKEDTVHRQHLIFQPPQTALFMAIMGFEQESSILWRKKLEQ